MPNELPLSSPIFKVDPSNPNKLVQERNSALESHGGKKQISEKNIKSIASIRKSGGSKKGKKAKSSSDLGKIAEGEEGAKVQYRRKSRKRKSSSN